MDRRNNFNENILRDSIENENMYEENEYTGEVENYGEEEEFIDQEENEEENDDDIENEEYQNFQNYDANLNQNENINNMEFTMKNNHNLQDIQYTDDTTNQNENLNTGDLLENNNLPEEPIYIMTLELERGKSEQIKIYSDSNPKELAFNFCKNKDLDFEAMNYLTQEIESLVIKYTGKINEENEEIVENSNENDSSVERDDRDNFNRNNNVINEVEESSKENDTVENTNNNRNIEEDENYINTNENENINEDQDTNQNLNNENFANTFSPNKKLHLFVEEELEPDELEPDEMQVRIETMHNENIKSENLDDIINENDKKEIIQKQITSKSNFNNNLNDDENTERENIIKFNKNILKETEEISMQNLNTDPNVDTNVNAELNKYYNKIPKPDKKSSNTIMDENNYITISNKENKVTIKQNSSHKILISNISQKCITKSSSYISNKNKKENIFERLFKDAEIKRRLPSGKSKLLRDYSGISICRNSSNFNQSILNTINNTENTPRPKSYVNNRKMKSISRVDSSYSHLMTNPSNMNYGVYLYQRGIILKEERIRNIAHAKSKIEDKELENNTFQPKIHFNPNIPISINRQGQLYSYRDYMKHKENVIEKIKIKNFETDENYTIENHKNSKPLNYFLSPHAEIKKQQKMEKINKEISQKYPFRPQTNQNFKFELNFQERQEIYKEAKIKIKSEIEEEKKILTDEKGNILNFQPVLISKSKNFNRNNNDVFNLNYEYAIRYKNKKDELIEKFNNNFNTENSLTNFESEIIYNNLKEDTFRKLFRDLDSDQDNLITVQSISLKSIPDNIKKIINPIVLELKEDEENLNEQEFVSAMNHLYEVKNL